MARKLLLHLHVILATENERGGESPDNGVAEDLQDLQPEARWLQYQGSGYVVDSIRILGDLSTFWNDMFRNLGDIKANTSKAAAKLPQ